MRSTNHKVQDRNISSHGRGKSPSVFDLMADYFIEFHMHVTLITDILKK